MDRRSRLNPSQLAVLQWIADGCPDGVMQGFTYKTTALALQDRRLVTVNKKGGVWRATITEAGAHYLAHGEYAPGVDGPQRPARRRLRPGKAVPPADAPSAAFLSTPPQPSQPPDPLSAALPKKAAAPRRAATPKSLSPTEQLVAEVVAAGGELEIDRMRRPNIETLIGAVNRYGKGPDGKQLVIQHHRYPASTVRLVDPPEWLHAALEPIPVPETLRAAHSVVVALREQESFRIRGPARHRALLLVQALITEAERRGHRVESGSAAPGRGSGGREPDGDVVVTIQGHQVGLQVGQQSDRVPHEPTAAELRRAERDSWYQVPTHDATPSERLTITVCGVHEHRQSTWNDTQRVNLETRLAQILQEVELRAAAMERDRVAREQALQDKRRRWEAAVEAAKVELVEHHRAEQLSSEVDRWRRAAAIRGYCDALEQQAAAAAADGASDLEAAEGAWAWAAWAREYADRIDPLRDLHGMPTDPEATPDALRPFLHGWSPYRPDRW